MTVRSFEKCECYVTQCAKNVKILAFFIYIIGNYVISKINHHSKYMAMCKQIINTKK